MKTTPLRRLFRVNNNPFNNRAFLNETKHLTMRLRKDAGLPIGTDEDAFSGD